MKKSISRSFFFAGLVVTLTASVLGLAKQTYADFPRDADGLPEIRYDKIPEADYLPFAVVNEGDVETVTPKAVSTVPPAPLTEEQIAARQKEQTRDAFAGMSADAKADAASFASERTVTKEVPLQKGETFRHLFRRLGIERGDWGYVQRAINEGFGARSKFLKPGHKFYAVKNEKSGELQALFFKTGPDSAMLVWDIYTSRGLPVPDGFNYIVTIDELQNAFIAAKPVNAQGDDSKQAETQKAPEQKSVAPAAEAKTENKTSAKETQKVENRETQKKAQKIVKGHKEHKRKTKAFAYKEFKLPTQTQTAYFVTEPLKRGESIAQALAEVKAPAHVAVQLQKMFPAINLSEMTRGATVELQMDNRVLPNGELAGQGIVTDARLTINGKTYEAHRVGVHKNALFVYVNETGKIVSSPFQRPKGTFTSRFYKRFHPILKIWRWHKGNDYAQGEGASIPALASGIVTASHFSETYGNMVEVRVNERVSYLIAHLEKPSPYKVGNAVKQGDTMGYEGHTGLAKKPHAHIEVHDIALTNETFEKGEFDPQTVFPGSKIDRAQMAELNQRRLAFNHQRDVAIVRKAEEAIEAERARRAEDARAHQAAVAATPSFDVAAWEKAAAQVAAHRKVFAHYGLHEAVAAYFNTKPAAESQPMKGTRGATLPDSMQAFLKERPSTVLAVSSGKLSQASQDITTPQNAKGPASVAWTLYQGSKKKASVLSAPRMVAQQVAFLPSRRDRRQVLAAGAGYRR